uniref:Uncharacterized protein n=1 Tax=Glossina pallidipes TaxID=7398 RepID=A0A1A9ZQN0_GLOPL
MPEHEIYVNTGSKKTCDYDQGVDYNQEKIKNSTEQKVSRYKIESDEKGVSDTADYKAKRATTTDSMNKGFHRMLGFNDAEEDEKAFDNNVQYFNAIEYNAYDFSPRPSPINLRFQYHIRDVEFFKTYSKTIRKLVTEYPAVAANVDHTLLCPVQLHRLLLVTDLMTFENFPIFCALPVVWNAKLELIALNTLFTFPLPMLKLGQAPHIITCGMA